MLTRFSRTNRDCVTGPRRRLARGGRHLKHAAWRRSQNVNFARYRPLFLGLTTVRIAGGRPLAVPLFTCTIGRGENVATSAERQPELQSAGRLPLGCVVTTTMAAGRHGNTGVDGFPEGLGAEQVSFAERHGRTEHDLKRGLISAKQTSTLASHADGRKLRAQARHTGETMPRGR